MIRLTCCKSDGETIGDGGVQMMGKEMRRGVSRGEDKQNLCMKTL